MSDEPSQSYTHISQNTLFIYTTYDTNSHIHTYFILYSVPDDVTMEELISVMGATRLKKVARKNRRKRNQKIREGKVVLNEKGEWVPTE